MTDLTHQALADVIHAIPFSQSSDADHVAAVVLAHLRPAVRFIGDLMDLPDDTIVSDADGDLFVQGSYWRSIDDGWTGYPKLPATVLYRPAD